MDPLREKIASTLRTLRAQRGWSLDLTASKTGVSKAMLGQIERGESSPTIATLWKIASGFEVSFSSFVESPTAQPPEGIQRSQPLSPLHPFDDKMRVTPIFPYDEQLRFEVFIIELLPGCEHLSPPHQKGVIEHVLVCSGHVEVLVQGRWDCAYPNEGLRFQADTPHGYRNRSWRSSVFHNIIHYQGPPAAKGRVPWNP